MSQSCGPAERDLEATQEISGNETATPVEVRAALEDFVPETMARVIIAEAVKPVALFFGTKGCSACGPEYEQMKELVRKINLSPPSGETTRADETLTVRHGEPPKGSGQIALVKIDAASGGLASEFGIRSVPAILLVDRGKVLASEFGGGAAGRFCEAVPEILRGFSR